MAALPPIETRSRSYLYSFAQIQPARSRCSSPHLFLTFSRNKLLFIKRIRIAVLRELLSGSFLKFFLRSGSSTCSKKEPPIKRTSASKGWLLDWEQDQLKQRRSSGCWP